MTTAHILLANDGFPRDKDMLDLYQGMQEYCYRINFYTAVDIVAGNLKVQKEDIFCGTINLCWLVWKQLGVKRPEVPDYPKELSAFMGRKIHKTTIGEFRKLLVDNEDNGIQKEYFIKPVQTKLFTGDLYHHQSQLEKFRGEIGSDTPIYLSRPVNFLSEYRVYVNQKLILGVSHYYGKWDIFPNPETIKEMVAAVNPVMPVSYSIDVGVVEDGSTTLVECNDGYALGNYGLEAKDYATLIRDRWWEITGHVQNS